MVLLIVLAVLAFVVLFMLSNAGSFFVIHQQTRGVVERLGKFERIAQAGLNFKLPFVESLVARVSLQVQMIDITVETKTKDNVFVDVHLGVQYQVLEESVKDAFYTLSKPSGQIQGYVLDTIRSELPKLTLDEAFEQKDIVAQEVRKHLDDEMKKYGYAILRVLVVNIEPDAKVKASMNEINAAQRSLVAAAARGEAARVLVVKNAEAESESLRLKGEGIAKERKAIIDGLRESLEIFAKAVPGTTAMDVLHVILANQYFDTLAKMGKDGAKVVFVPHSPSSIVDIGSQIRDGMMQGGEISGPVLPSPKIEPPAAS